jgi:hypothetical protein
VVLHRLRVWVDLEDDLGTAVITDMDVEAEQARLVLLRESAELSGHGPIAPALPGWIRDTDLTTNGAAMAAFHS